MAIAQDIERAVAAVKDQETFLHTLLADTLEWPIPGHVEQLPDLGYGWTEDDLRAQGIAKKLLDGQVWQLRLRDHQPWGIFVVEFADKRVYRSDLRKVLRGLVPSRRRDSNLPAWKHDNLLFLCTTKDYDRFTVAHFRGEKAHSARLAAFGWKRGDPHLRTLCEHNLPALAWPDDGGRDDAGWLKAWAAAFDVEAVTQRFFTEYAGVFHEVEGKVKGVPKGEPRRLYTQRLFNRLLFLYFIQRKGWLSLHGDTNYLRALYTAAVAGKEDFLNDRLYWAYFYGLNNGMEDRDSHSAAELVERRGTVPFLNGGLFDLEDDHDIQGKVKVPNAAFADILDLFERYNFTVAESTPLDVEVAVDPEMLGKVFEELVTGRHESGSYYTPRPVVTFMCREALKHYLASTLARSASEGHEEALTRFVDDGDPKLLTDPEGVLDALKRVKVCDPACGSGAYLLGMMHELLRLRDLLFARHHLDQRTVYDRKLEIIQNNLYGVDLDPFAVNIAKLRLWLSLAVDFNGTGDPPPLPNLDFKIECGDSLTAPDPQRVSDLFRATNTSLADELTTLKGDFIKAHGPAKKKLAGRVKEIEGKLRANLLDDSPEGSIDWRVAFAEVFRGGGFDIVIGNPPYIRQEEFRTLKPVLKRIYECYTGVADLFVYFYERGIKLLKPGGQFAFITSNKWYRSGYGEKLRSWLGGHTRLHRLTDFGDAPVFEAIAYPTIVLLERNQPAESTSFHALTWEPGPPIEDFAEVVHKRSFDIPQASLQKTGWRLEGSAKRNMLEKLRAAGKPLGEYCNGRFYYGIKTGLNDAFVVDRETRDRLIAEHPSSEKVLKPYLRGRDVKRWKVEPADLWLLYIPWHFPLHLDDSISGVSSEAERRFRKEYPAVYEHLCGFRTELAKRNAAETGIRYE